MARTIVDHAAAETPAMVEDSAGDIMSPKPGTDDGLHRLIQSWPNLPEPVQQRILVPIRMASLTRRRRRRMSLRRNVAARIHPALELVVVLHSEVLQCTLRRRRHQTIDTLPVARVLPSICVRN